MTAKEIYPEAFEESYCAPYEYQPMLDSFGKILIQVDDDNYTGDSRVLYEGENGTVGYLLFGWGSCSGCDSLQSCNSFEEVDVLIESLKNQIKWLPVAEMLEFFKTHDWEGDYTYHRTEQAKFNEEVIKLLEERNASKETHS